MMLCSLSAGARAAILRTARFVSLAGVLVFAALVLFFSAVVAAVDEELAVPAEEEVSAVPDP
jgi:hypothetical protein